MSARTIANAQAFLLAHRFPRYSAAQEGITPHPDGDYVHELHAQALTERILLAREALKCGKAGAARDLLDEAFEYLKRPTHTR